MCYKSPVALGKDNIPEYVGLLRLHKKSSQRSDRGSMLIKEKNVLFLYIHVSINSDIFSITFIIISVHFMDISFQ